jgi:hypothetical protein
VSGRLSAAMVGLLKAADERPTVEIGTRPHAGVTTFGALVDRGLIEHIPRSRGLYRITPAGRAALAAHATTAAADRQED